MIWCVHLFLKQVLPIFERSQFALFLLVFKLVFWRSKVEDQILEWKNNGVQWERQRRRSSTFILPTQSVQTPEEEEERKRERKKEN